ncbi:MAG: HlyC/CorC family transporter, partial [Gammaproteobacteria bacterium]
PSLSDIPLGVLYAILALLLLLSAFFSGTETAMMSLNRYRLRHRARSGHRGARLAERLLKRPDRLIGLILLGNNLVNFVASALTTLIAYRLGGDAAVAVAVLVFTLTVLIFAEVMPKTLAAMHPARLALPAAYIYYPLLKVLYPVVWVVNAVANGLLRLVGVSPADRSSMTLSGEELRTVVMESTAFIPKRHRQMLLGILDLTKVTVEDAMVPRSDIDGIDLDDDWDEILDHLIHTRHTRLPVYRESLDDLVGVLHVRKLLRDLPHERLDKERLVELLWDPYFVPEGTLLYSQLLAFQQTRRRVAFAVDEYGDIQGLVTVDDILEEIVGEFTTDPGTISNDVHREPDGSYIVTGSAHVRALNRMLNWGLPTNGPKTLNGLIVEALETIPASGTKLTLHGHPVKILQIADNAVKTARMRDFVPVAGDDKDST